MKSGVKTRLKMIVPSLFAVILFLIPVEYNGSSELIVGILGDWIQTALGDALIPLLVAIIVADAALSLACRLLPLPFVKKNPQLKELFSPSLFWLVTRVIGGVLAVLTYFQLGPEAVWSADTGGNMLTSILPSCIMWYIIGGFFLSLLTDYGLMDLLSSLFTKVARRLFCVPGRAMIDCVTSWLGCSVCGTYLTISQYESGQYNAKEAAIIICNFSLLSVSFCSLIANMLDFNDIFPQFYLTISIASLLCAVILPRLWPLRSMSTAYDARSGKQVNEDTPQGVNGLQWGYRQALARAAGAPGPVGFLRTGAYNVVNLIITTLPNMMAIGTIALVLANYTSLFDYLGIPLGMYLQLFQVPDAMEAGSSILVGFVDQFIPVIVGSSMTATLTKFVLGTISIIQIVYISDIGTLILTSRVPLNLGHLFVIFLERVLISIPVVVLCAHLFGVV